MISLRHANYLPLVLFYYYYKWNNFQIPNCWAHEECILKTRGLESILTLRKCFSNIFKIFEETKFYITSTNNYNYNTYVIVAW